MTDPSAEAMAAARRIDRTALCGSQFTHVDSVAAARIIDEVIEPLRKAAYLLADVAFEASGYLNIGEEYSINLSNRLQERAKAVRDLTMKEAPMSPAVQRAFEKYKAAVAARTTKETPNAAMDEAK